MLWNVGVYALHGTYPAMGFANANGVLPRDEGVQIVEG